MDANPFLYQRVNRKDQTAGHGMIEIKAAQPAPDFHIDRFWRFHTAASLTHGTSRIDGTKEIAPRLHPRHLHKIQGCHAHNTGLHAVHRKFPAQEVQDFLLFLLALHINEISNDDAADIPQP